MILQTSERSKQAIELSTNALVLIAVGQWQLHIIDGQLEELRRRLDKLYSALETGSLEVGDLAPGIKALKSEIDTLESQ